MFVFDNSPGAIKAELIEKLRDQAHWRRRVAERFPEDPRNLRAAELCADLAARFHDLPDSDPGLQLLFDAHHVWVSVVAAFEDDEVYEPEQMHIDRAEAEDRVWREMGFHVKYSRFCVLTELVEIPIVLFNDAEEPVFAAAQARGLDDLRDRLRRLVPAEIDAPEASALAAREADV